MGLKVKSTQVALNGSTGTQNITISGFGTPKAAIIMVNFARTSDAQVNHACLSIGMTDGTRQTCSTHHSQDGRDLTGEGRERSYRIQSATEVIVLQDRNDANTIQFLAEFSQWITDGIQIDITKATKTDSYYATVTLFGGTDIANVYVDNYDDLGILTDPTSITDPGFQADLVFTLSAADNDALTDPPSTVAHATQTFGAWVRGSDDQKCTYFLSRNGADPTRNRVRLENNNAICRVNDDGGAILNYVANISSNVNGFNVTSSDSALNNILGYMAIKWVTVPQIALIDVQLPSSVVDYVETGLSFTPSFGLIAITNATTVNDSHDGDNNGVAYSVLEDGQIYTMGFAHDDNESVTTNSACWASPNKMLYLQSNGATVLHEGSLQSIDSNGWTIDLGGGTHDSTARRGWALAIGTSVGATLTDVKLVDLENSSQASLTSLKWDWFDESSPNSFTTPTDQGTVEATDANGNITIDLPNSTLTSGQTGFLILRDATNNYIGAYRLDVD